MAYVFEVTKDFEVIVKENDKSIDTVGSFDTFESASYWATEMQKKFDANLKLIYGQHNQEPDAETL